MGSADGNTRAKFKEWRRRWIEQVMRDTTLRPIVRVIGYGISKHLNRDTGLTFIHPSTLAAKLHVKLAQGKDALQQLAAGGHLTIDGSDLVPDVRENGPPQLMAGGGGREFYELRGQWLDWVIFDDLPIAQRVAAYGIAAMTNPVTREFHASCREIAAPFGLSPTTISNAMKTLREVGWLDQQSPILSIACPLTVHSLSTLQTDVRAESSSCALDFWDSGNHQNIRSPAETERARRARSRSAPSAVRFADQESYDQWCGLYDFITGDYSNVDYAGEPWTTIGAVLQVGEEWGGLNVTAAEVAYFIRYGLLERLPRSKRITITPFGHAAYENGYVPDDEEKVAR